MAKEDANEQIKEILRQIIRHRFWITIGFAALFAVIAYFVGSGPVEAKAKSERDNITKAEKDVKAYQLPTKPTEKYKPVVVEKTEIVDKDVTKAWRELYNRQAPLLTWPKRVQDRFQRWGRKWPEEEGRGKVSVAIVDYIAAYPEYVDMVYKTFEPFDYETGKGIVAAPPRDALLQPSQFTVENRPSLGKVWSAQERLWIQRTVLEVIHQVNKNAKDWDSAIVKQIDELVVASQSAQDQRSVAKNEPLTKAPDILAPGEVAPSEDGGGGGAGMSMMGGGGKGGAMDSMMAGGSMRRGMGMGGSGGGGAAQADDSIYYVEKGKSKILPVSITVLIEQDRVQDLLVELENSPMAIQVMDIDLERAPARVTKPEKGEQAGGMGMGGMGMMGGMGGRMRGMMGGQMGFGGMASQMRGQMMSQMGGMRMGGMGMGGMGMGGMGMGGMGMGGMGGTGRTERKKVDTSNLDRKKDREKKDKELEEKKGPTLVDPYFNIVQLTVYGQARFFEPPPVEPPAEPSLGATPASPASPGAPGQTPQAAPAVEKAATPAAEQGAVPASGAESKAAKAQPETGAAPAKPAEKPATDVKPAAQPAPAAPAKPEIQGNAVKK